MAGQEENSFQEYKKYLEDSIGVSDILKPPRIMSPYSLFYFERQTQEKSKGKIDIISLNKVLAEEWKSLPNSKKEYYFKIHEIRKREYNDLKQEYKFLTNRLRAPNAYICYFKEKYPSLYEAHKNLGYDVVTKMIASDWKNLDSSARSIYEKLAQIERDKRGQSEEERKELIEIYEEKVKEFKEKLQEDKQKILKKYGVKTKVQIKKQKKEQEKKKNFKQKAPTKKSPQSEQIKKSQVRAKYTAKVQKPVQQSKAQSQSKQIRNKSKQKVEEKAKTVRKQKSQAKLEIPKPDKKNSGEKQKLRSTSHKQNEKSQKRLDKLKKKPLPKQKKVEKKSKPIVTKTKIIKKSEKRLKNIGKKEKNVRKNVVKVESSQKISIKNPLSSIGTRQKK